VAAISKGIPTKEELFELVVESSTDFAIFTTGPEGAITSWNVGAERLFGYSAGEVLSCSADLIFTPEDQAEDAAEKERSAARADGRATDERWHQRKDGSRFWASGLMMPLRGGNGFVKITRDRTEQHRAAERLARKRGALSSLGHQRSAACFLDALRWEQDLAKPAMD